MKKPLFIFLIIFSILLVVGGIVLMGAVAIKPKIDELEQNIEDLQTSAQSAVKTPYPTVSFDFGVKATAAPALLPPPVYVEFVPLNMKVELIALGLDDEGRMDVPQSADVGSWYKYGPSPGMDGNALLSGHKAWRKKVGAFNSIKKLKIGDTVRIYYEDDSTMDFEVVSNDTYKIEDVPESVMQLDGESRVTMITCSGDYSEVHGGSDSRTIVVLKLPSA